MDIFFADPDEVPVPPEEMQIRSLTAHPLPDGTRVSVHLEVTPFQKRPNFQIAILDNSARRVAELSVVEAMEAKMDLTVHLRIPEPAGRFVLQLRVFYSDLDAFDPEGREDLRAGQILDETGWTVATHEQLFEISPQTE